jgi:hypothetical protein
MTMHANDLALGKPHCSAYKASITDFGDCFRVDLYWTDGAHVYDIHDTQAEAVEHLNRLGFTIRAKCES